ncbi:hypothetical protein CC86DRAFT_411696 [Ophiobolus disseminans]|uniref:Protein kinase domain-containing protein n=1 Tax=Ophiobolus disseminans TaxID=1469910 RepID=A0A6A6ZJD9_9PLEO|nr:hypothetical protein CC86DRAFT_411696 [Ophiobolus disseminans]
MESPTRHATEALADLREQGCRCFINTSRLQDVLAQDHILKILAEYGAGPYQILNYGDIIRNKAPKLFAILVWIQQPHLIITLVGHQIFDKSLPLDRVALQHVPELTQLHPQFFHVQYEFIPHFFEKGLDSYIDDSQLVLPFVVEERLEDVDGAFSSISRVEIHPSFQNLLPESETHRFLIQKEVSSSTEYTSFEGEKANLELLHCIKHPNIVELLSSYTLSTSTYTTFPDGTELTVVRPKHFFLFREEPMDLHAFLRAPQPYGQFIHDETYYLALQGLASALECIHDIRLNKLTHSLSVDVRRIGSHRDIRLPNILVRTDTFLLADFGLTDFKDPSNERRSKTTFKAGKGDYIAPECYGNTFDHQAVGRSMDIWAFGCVLIEVATYMMLGPEGLKNFQSRRISLWLQPISNGFFFQNGALKSEVLDHISELRKSTNDHAYLKLLDLSQNMLRMKFTERPGAREVWHVLRCICMAKLYSQLQSALDDYDQSLEAKPAASPSRVTQWFEMERVRAWADVLGFQQDEITACEDLENTIDVDACQAQLRELKCFVRQHYKRTAQSLQGKDGSQQLVTLHAQFEESLSRHVRSLYKLLPMRLQKRADNWWTQRLLQDRATETFATHATRNLLSSHEPYEQLTRRALVKRNLQAISETSNPDPDVYQLCLDPTKLSEIRSNDSHDYSIYLDGTTAIRVLVEPTSIAIDENANFQISADEIAIRKSSLATLLATPRKPLDFHVLDCIGFVDVVSQEPRVGYAKFIYRLPEICQPHSEEYKSTGDPYSLLQILDHKSNDGTNVPPLEIRIQLAQVLVTSIHSLHLSGWLHKSLNADNILLFRPSHELWNFTDPRIVGFRDSRPDGDIWTSSGPSVNPLLDDYIHPRYRKINEARPTEDLVGQARFRRVYDYYSVGVLLLEIGLWRSLGSMLKKANSSDADTRRLWLLKNYLPRLGPMVGSTYARAVNKCLNTNYSAEKPGVGAEHQVNEFYLDVVEPVSELRI